MTEKSMQKETDALKKKSSEDGVAETSTAPDRRFLCKLGEPEVNEVTFPAYVSNSGKKTCSKCGIDEDEHPIEFIMRWKKYNLKS